MTPGRPASSPISTASLDTARGAASVGPSDPGDRPSSATPRAPASGAAEPVAFDAQAEAVAGIDAPEDAAVDRPSRVARSASAARRARAALTRASRRAVMAAAVALGASFLVALPAHAAPGVGQAAPDFVARDTQGTTHKLSDFRGKYVVLEWTNPGCPFVRKHYGGGNMPATQKTATARGAVWLTINSTERAASDYLLPAAMAAWMKDQGGTPSAVLMDEDGVIGRAYGARTTPHLFIIDPAGTLVYAGGIDSIASARPDDIKTATNYVNQALSEAFGGQRISAASTRAYGCSIKYKG